MLSRNRDSIIFGFGLASGIIGIISLLLTSVGVGIPSWYQGKDANNSVIISQSNLFYSCFAPNISSGLICTSYNSYLCSTTSYQNTVLNVTAYISGCTNPINGSSSYLYSDGPIYQILLDDFYRLRCAAALSIISIVFIFFSTIFSFLNAFIVLNSYFILISPILACIGVTFGICCLVTAGSVFTYTGAGFALFVVGVIIELIVIILLSIIAGRLNGMERIMKNREDQQMYTHPVKSPIIIRRIHKQRI